MRFERQRAVNQRNWDDRAKVHAASRFYDLARYREDPEHISDVVAFDRARVGDVSGRRLLHLQCHIGTDTLSWARLGAEVTGLDFSEQSIAVARQLFADTATAGTFVQSDVYDARTVIDGEFDLVYTSAGVINWLPDLRPWARIVAQLLAPGASFHMTEFHPMSGTIDDEGDTTTLRVRYPYFRTDEPQRWDDAFTYTDNPAGPITSAEHYGWGHGLGEVLSALLEAGLRLTAFEEHIATHWRALPQMIPEDGLWRLPPDQRDLLPLMFSVSARRD